MFSLFNPLSMRIEQQYGIHDVCIIALRIPAKQSTFQIWREENAILPLVYLSDARSILGGCTVSDK